MTRFLLDRDVISQLDQPTARRNDNVAAWLGTVPDNCLYVSAITVMEGWKGYARLRNRAADAIVELRDRDRREDAFRRVIAAFAGRIIPIDAQIAEAWGLMLAQQDKHRFDACVAATAIIRNMVVVSRNRRDFVGRGAPVLDPFHRRPTVEIPKP